MKKLAILFLAGLALLSSACHRHRGWTSADPAERAQAVLKHLSKKLDLDADQKTKALPILLAMATEREEWRGEGADLVKELRLQAGADKFDKAALNKALLAKEAKWAQSRQETVERLAELHALLKPEQRKKAAEMLEHLEKRLKR
jgi:Spy/CpxP family protein refolding chaperone